MNFEQELRALIDRHLDPASIYSHYFIILALRVEVQRLDQQTAKFPDDAEHIEGQLIEPEVLRAYYDQSERLGED